MISPLAFGALLHDRIRSGPTRRQSCCPRRIRSRSHRPERAARTPPCLPGGSCRVRCTSRRRRWWCIRGIGVAGQRVGVVEADAAPVRDLVADLPRLAVRRPMRVRVRVRGRRVAGVSVSSPEPPANAGCPITAVRAAAIATTAVLPSCLQDIPVAKPSEVLRSARRGLLRCPRIAGRGDPIPGVRCLSRFWPLPDALLTTTTRPGHRCRSRCRSRRSAVELGRSPHATPHRACVDRRGATASAPIYMAPGSRCRQRAEAARLLRASPLPGVVLRQGYSPKPPIWRHSTKSTRQLLATSAPPGRSSSKVNRYAVVCVTRFEVCVPDGAPRSNVASIMPFEKVVEIGSP